MTISTYLKWGTGAGLIGGVISSGYYAGKSNKDLSKQAQKDALASAIAELITTSNKSTLCLFTGPLTGAAIGSSLYGIKNYKSLIKPVQLTTWLITLTAISAFSAYQIGKHE